MGTIPLVLASAYQAAEVINCGVICSSTRSARCILWMPTGCWVSVWQEPTCQHLSPWRCHLGWDTAHSWGWLRSCRHHRTKALWSFLRWSSWLSRSHRPRRNSLQTHTRLSFNLHFISTTNTEPNINIVSSLVTDSHPFKALERAFWRYLDLVLVLDRLAWKCSCVRHSVSTWQPLIDGKARKVLFTPSWRLNMLWLELRWTTQRRESRSQRSDRVLDLQSAWTAVLEWMKASLSWWGQHTSTDATAGVKKLTQANGKLSAQTVGMQSQASDFVNQEIRNSKLRKHNDNSSTAAQLSQVFLRGRIVISISLKDLDSTEMWRSSQWFILEGLAEATGVRFIPDGGPADSPPDLHHSGGTSSCTHWQQCFFLRNAQNPWAEFCNPGDTFAYLTLQRQQSMKTFQLLRCKVITSYNAITKQTAHSIENVVKEERILMLCS